MSKRRSIVSSNCAWFEAMSAIVRSSGIAKGGVRRMRTLLSFSIVSIRQTAQSWCHPEIAAAVRLVLKFGRLWRARSRLKSLWIEA